MSEPNDQKFNNEDRNLHYLTNAQIAGGVKSHLKKEETLGKMTKFEMLIHNEDHVLGCIKD